MVDRWNEQLRCPQCQQIGLASLSQLLDAEMPIVDCIPDGFKAIKTEYGPNFHCGACDVPGGPVRLPSLANLGY
jgi:hypothetical protein